jgi:flagellar biosynthetic protein FliP
MISATGKRFCVFLGLLLFLGLAPDLAAQQLDASPEQLSFKMSLDGGGFSKAINIFLMMTLLSLAPAAVMMMTSYTRIVIVLGFLKQAMGTQQAPSNRIVGGLALFLTLFIMQPVWSEMYDTAITPYSEGRMDQKTAMDNATKPLKTFMLKQTRESSLLLFMDMANMESVESPEQLPMRVVMPAFVLSELKTAFQMGFLIYLPFLIVDIVVSTVLMSMGMMMLPPAMISMPFKLLLFILVDGWDILIKTLVLSFN